GMGIVDFSNPKACEWFSDKLKALLDMGVDSFKTDFGERIPTNVVYYDGSDPFKMHNYYSYKFNEVVFKLLQKKKEKRKLLYSPVQQQLVVKNSQFIGEVTVIRHMKQWLRACVVDYH